MKREDKLLRKLQEHTARERRHLDLLCDHVDEAHLTLEPFPTDDQIRYLTLVEKCYANFQAHINRPFVGKKTGTVHLAGRPVQNSGRGGTEATMRDPGETPRQESSGDATSLAPRHLLRETTKKLMHRRDQLDKRLILEDERGIINKRVYKQRERLLEKQRQLGQDELEHLRALATRHAKARHRLSKNRCGRYIKEEHRLRHVIAIFKTHLGPYLDDLDFDTTTLYQKTDQKETREPRLVNAAGTSQKKRNSEMEEAKGKRRKKTKPAQPVQVFETSQSTSHQSDDSTEKRASWPDNVLHIVLRPGSGDRDALEARRAQDRRRLDRIVAPHLNDNGTVYDLPPTQMEMDPDVYMSGGLNSTEDNFAPVQSDNHCVSESPPRQRRRDRRASHKIVLSSSSSSVAGDHERYSDGGGQLATTRRSQSKLSSLKPAIIRDQGYRGIAKGDPAQKVSQVSKTNSAKTPTLLPKVWGSPVARRRDPGTRISGPYNNPTLPSLKVDGPGPQSHDCLQVCSSSSSDHVGQVGKSQSQGKTPKSQSSSSPWRGKSTTPIPLPRTPIPIATSSAPVTESKSLSVTESMSAPASRKICRRHQVAGESKAVASSTSEYKPSPDGTTGQLRPQVAACFPGTAEDDRTALAVEKKRWRRMLSL